MMTSGKKILAVLGLVVLAYMVLDLNHRISELMQLTADRDAMATEVYTVKQTEAYLEAQIAYANSDSAVEEWAREEAFMAKSGDHPIMMMPDPNFTPQPTPVAREAPVVYQNYEIWGELFFGQ